MPRTLIRTAALGLGCGLWLLLGACHVEVKATHSSDPLPYVGDAPASADTAVAVVNAWVPFGTGVAAAMATMKNHGFRCELHPDSSFGTETHLDYISGERDYGGPTIYERWHIALVYADGKVNRIEARTELNGP